MRRFAMTAAAVSVALGSALAIPMAAQAIPLGGQWVYYGTYPTAAACLAAGPAARASQINATTYRCDGSHNLYLLESFPS
jgi:hypothetical protein